ncbi:MAG TPA: hypothetical protein VN711_02025 [Candidatus Saccharimonadales bacterium]|nr:hypothetical protein [Candidatus Saccharimonadales bacterium]
MEKAPVQSRPRQTEKGKEPADGSLAWHIREFDTNPREHGLDRDWYKFHGIGFLMNTQMHLLPEGAEERSRDLNVWAEQTKRDILGFALEYLSKGLVFSYKYKIHTKEDGTQELVDPLYGNRGAVEMIDEKERGGVVKKNMERIQDFFLDPATKDGAIAVVPSPKGPSGLITDDGKAIDYLTSFFFVMQKKGDEIIGSTIKTDFTNKEYRAMIQTLTGQTLPFDASLQDFVRAIALINPNERRQGVKTVNDVIGLMRQTKMYYRGEDTAFEGRKWREIYDGVANGEELYQFNQKTQDYVGEFMQYIGEGKHTRLELQKAVAATLLRVSQVFLSEQNAQQINRQLISTSERNIKGAVSSRGPAMPVTILGNMLSFGQVFKEVQQIKGCAGGGTSNESMSVMTMGGYRNGRINSASREDESSWFVCPKCEEKAKPPVGEQCPHCKYTKDDFIKEHPELAC